MCMCFILKYVGIQFVFFCDHCRITLYPLAGHNAHIQTLCSRITIFHLMCLKYPASFRWHIPQNTFYENTVTAMWQLIIFSFIISWFVLQADLTSQKLQPTFPWTTTNSCISWTVIQQSVSKESVFNTFAPHESHMSVYFPSLCLQLRIY